ncbi:hypothetical protein A2U01_0072546, partial [Trifolium medium]|nr:hypothetical protein [Trifolium medium]
KARKGETKQRVFGLKRLMARQLAKRKKASVAVRPVKQGLLAKRDLPR